MDGRSMGIRWPTGSGDQLLFCHHVGMLVLFCQILVSFMR